MALNWIMETSVKTVAAGDSPRRLSRMSATSDDVDVNDLTTCCICFQMFVHPQKLPCDHTYCATCMDRLQVSGMIKCPLCNQVFSAQQVRADFRLARFIEVLTEKLAVSNTQPTSAAQEQVCGLCKTYAFSHWCKDCKKLICRTCMRAHASMGGDQHRTLGKAEYLKEAATRVRMKSVKLGLDLESLRCNLQLVTDVQERSTRLVRNTMQTLDEQERECMRKVQMYFTKKRAEIGRYQNSFVAEQSTHEVFTRITKLEQALEHAKSGALESICKTEQFLDETEHRISEIEIPKVPDIKVPDITVHVNKDWQMPEIVRVKVTKANDTLTVNVQPQVK